MTAPWVVENYPSKRALSRAEAMTVLRRGPEPVWFEPFAVRQGYAHPAAPFRFALVHVHGDPVWGHMRTFWCEEDLRWAMEHAYGRHRNRACPGCQGFFYMTPVPPSEAAS